MHKILTILIALVFPVILHAQVFYLVEYTGKTGNGHKAMVVYSNDTNIEVRHYHESSGKIYVDHYESSETEDPDQKGEHLTKAEEAIKQEKNEVELTVWATADPNAPVYIWYWDPALSNEEQNVPYVSFSMQDVLDRNRDKWVKADSFRKVELGEMTDDMLDYYYAYQNNTGERELYERMREARDMAASNVDKGDLLSEVSDMVTDADVIAERPTIHLLELTNDIIMDIGTQCSQDGQAMRSEITGIARLLGMNARVYDVSGDQFSFDGLKRAIQNLKPSPDDVIIFHYSGHGFRFDDQEDAFPQLSLCPTGYEDVLDGNYIGLSDIYEALVVKKPRLCLVLGDCCNSFLGVPRPITQTAFLSRDRSNFDVERLKSLFLEAEGSIISTAASPGEVSWCDTSGGMYTNAFLQSLRSEISLLAEGEPSWDNIFTTAISQAQTRSSKLVKAQHGMQKSALLKH